MSETTENNTTNILDHGDVEEDDSLDNFFKKKDKKGKKKKSKKSEAGGSEKSSLKSKKKEADHKKDPDSAKVDGSQAADQEEWIDFEDESERDYSDLKIQNMQISDNLNEQISGIAPEYDESGELIPPKPVEGPWKQVSSAQPAPPAASAPPQPAPQPEAPKKVGAYRPPQARASGSGSNLVPSALPKRNRRQQVPQMNNEFDFPSLGQIVKDPTIPPKGFEMVKHGSKTSTWQNQQVQNAKASELKLDNQFSALNTDNQ